MTAKRFTLLIPSGPAHDHERKHLFIILTNTCDEGKQLLVSISTYYDDDTCDETCILNPGDHEFIRRKSFVVYRRCQITETAALLRGLRDKKLVPREPMDADIFEEICEGLLSSIFTPRKYVEYFEKNKHIGDDPGPPEEITVEDQHQDILIPAERASGGSALPERASGGSGQAVASSPGGIRRSPTN